MKKLISFLRDEEGATAIEYGLLAALIAIAMAVGASLLGVSLNSLFSDVASELDVAVP